MPLAGTQLTIQQTADYARQAGWSGPALVTIVAIAMCESNLYTHATNPSDPAGGSFGILQINASHFGKPFGVINGPDTYVMSQGAALDPYLSFLYAQPLSNYGRNFSAWSTYTNGCYLTHVDAVRSAIGGGGSSSNSSPFPAYTGTPWYQYGVYSDYGYNGSQYLNVDVGTPVDTPITAPLAGTITDIGYFDWGGQVTIKVDDPSAINGYKDYFVIHLDALNPYLATGQHIDAGTFLGYSGGQTSNAGLPPTAPGGLAHHVTLPSHSTGPHLDIGVTNSDTGSLVDNSQAAFAASNKLVRLAMDGLVYGTQDVYGTGAGAPPPGGIGNVICQMFPWACQNGQPPPTGGAGNVLAQTVHNTLVQYPGFFGICKAIDEANQFQGFINEVTGPSNFTDTTGWTELPTSIMQSVSDTVIGNSIPVFVRGTLILAGIFLILALLWQLAKPNLEALPSLVALAAA